MTALFNQAQTEATLQSAADSGDPNKLLQTMVEVLKEFNKGASGLEGKLDQVEKGLKAVQQEKVETTPIPPSPESRPSKEPEHSTGMASKGSKKRWDERMPLSRLKGVDKLTHFKGERAEFPTFRKKLVNFLAEEPKLREVLKDISKNHKEKIIDDRALKDLARKYDDDGVSVEAYSSQLHSLLINITESTAFDLVDGIVVDGKEGNGFEAWRVLNDEFAPETPEDRRSLVRKITHPEHRAKDYNGILQAQTLWQSNVDRYNDMLKDGESKLADDILISGYIALLPDKVAEAINNLHDDLETMAEVKRYVKRQVVKHCKEKGDGKLVFRLDDEEKDKEEREQGDDEEKNDEAEWSKEQLGSMMKGGFKGYGKGGKGGGYKGKGGGFQGKCNYCGQEGHMKRDCKELDKVMEEQRGKGGWKGGDWNKGGGKDGGWKGGWQGQWNGGWDWGKGGQEQATKGGWYGRQNQKGYGKASGGTWGWGKGGGGKGKGGKGHYGGGVFSIDEDYVGGEGDCSYYEEAFTLTKEPHKLQNRFAALKRTSEEDEDEDPGDFPIVERPGCNEGGRVRFEKMRRKTQKERKDEEAAGRKRRQDEKVRRRGSEEVQKANVFDAAKVPSCKLVSRARCCVPADEAGVPKHLHERCKADCVIEGCCEETVEARISSMLNYLDEDPEDDTLLAWGMEEKGMPSEDFIHVRSIMDSGAVEHVTNRDIVPGVPVKPSPGSQRGQCYVAANGSRIANEGQQELSVCTEDGGTTDMTFQVTEVQRPLCSVAQLCDRGNRVVFGSSGGVIHNLRSGRLTPFRRRGGVYTLDLWIRQADDKASGFTRPR